MTTLDTAPADVREQSPVDGEPCVLLKLGEVVLKGKNREQFERRLADNVRRAVRPIARVDVVRRHGVFIIRKHDADPATMERVAQRVTDVMGIVWAHRAWRVGKDLASVERAALELMDGRTGTFAVRSRRRDKRFPMTSTELDRHIGGLVAGRYGQPVKLKDPEHTLSIDHTVTRYERHYRRLLSGSTWEADRSA